MPAYMMLPQMANLAGPLQPVLLRGADRRHGLRDQRQPPEALLPVKLRPRESNLRARTLGKVLEATRGRVPYDSRSRGLDPSVPRSLPSRRLNRSRP